MENATFGEKFRALLATGRVANLPTVWSNVLVVFWLSSELRSFTSLGAPSDPAHYYVLIIACVAASLLYIGGCWLGDCRDAEFDRIHRSNRPIPKGILSAGKLAIFAGLFLLFGILLGSINLLITWVISNWEYRNQGMLDVVFSDRIIMLIPLHQVCATILLATCIVLYAFLHKKNRPLALTLMASCRGLLVIFAFALAYVILPSFWGHNPFEIKLYWLKPWIVLWALTVAAYTFLLSWVASTESNNTPFSKRNLLGAALLLLPAISLATTYMQVINLDWMGIAEVSPRAIIIGSPLFYGAIIILYLAWIFFALRALKQSKPRFVSMALAGFCLLDACFAATYSICIALICLALFLLALLLQKFTPAT